MGKYPVSSTLEASSEHDANLRRVLSRICYFNMRDSKNLREIRFAVSEALDRSNGDELFDKLTTYAEEAHRPME